MNRKVSIITPCLNSEKTIEDTIKSVLNQTYKNIEYIVVDGGSSDRTMEIVKKYEPLFQGRMRYVSEPDKGIYNAMNKGIKMSTGSLIGIINSDDYYESYTIEHVVNSMSADKYQVLYGWLRVLQRKHFVKYIQTTHLEFPDKAVAHPTCFVSRDVYRKYGLFLESLKLSADYEFLLRLYKSEAVKFILLPEVLANFRLGGASCNNYIYGNFECEIARMIHGYGNFRKLIQAIIKMMFQYII